MNAKKPMKTIVKQLSAAILALAVVISLLPAAPVQAATTTKSYNNYSYSVDVANSKASVSEVDRSPSRTYKDVSSKIKATVSEEVGEDSIVVSVTTKNNYTDYASGNHFILIYNAEDQIIGCSTRSFYLKSKASDTTSVTLYMNLYPGFDHYKVYTRAYHSAYKSF